MTPAQVCESEYERQYNLDYLRGDITCPPLPDTGGDLLFVVIVCVIALLVGLAFVVGAMIGREP